MKKVVFVACLLLALAATAQTAPTSSLKVGDTAPNFTLKDQNGQPVSLDQYRGKKNVAVAFLVFAFSGG